MALTVRSCFAVLLLAFSHPAALSGPSSQKKLRGPLQVFILAGQSNMQGHANVSTLDSLADDPKTAPLLREIRNPDGSPRVCSNVWISCLGCEGNQYSDLIEQTGRLATGFGASKSEIGPELTFGMRMERSLKKPILIIKTAWGGRSLCLDFRPPGAGLYNLSDYELARLKERKTDAVKEQADRDRDCGVFYRHMIAHVKKVLADIKRVVPDYDATQGYELAGFVWFQGFNDLVNGWRYPDDNFEEYGRLMAQFIRDVRSDLAAPRLPFVIGVMGIDGAKAGPNHQAFRKAQASPALLPEFYGNVAAVQTAPYWDDDLGALQQRRERLDARLDREIKTQPGITQAAREDARNKAMSQEFTADELKRMKGISNGGYHYLGAAKILAPIGEAFADAALSLQMTRRGRK